MGNTNCFTSLLNKSSCIKTRRALSILPIEKCAVMKYSYSKPFSGQKRKGLLAPAGSAVSSAQTLTNVYSLL